MLFHVSNRYMELGSVVAAIAQSRGEVARLNRRDAAPASRPAEPGVARVWPAAPQDRAIEPWIVLVAKNEKDFGAIATGRFADIIAVQADPLTDVTALERMQFVMKEGRVYRGTAEQCAAAPAAWPCERPAE